MLPEILIGVVAGLICGCAAAWALLQGRQREDRQRIQQLADELARQSAAHNERESGHREEIARLAAERAHLEQDAERSANALTELHEETNRLRSEFSQSQTELATLRAMLEAERKSAREKAEARVEMSNQFEVLANRILEEKSKRFTEQNQANLGNLLNPLKEKFGEFQFKVESLEKDSVAGRSELKVQIEQLRSLNERLSQDATNLVTALKGSSKTQGDWGEYVLESILESSGLRKGHEYRVQESFTRDDRSRARVDVILDLPEGRHIILDSKVSLNDYSDYCAAEEEIVREAALARHLASVRNHIRDLSQRNYPALFELNSLDFVVMFIPIEPAFMLAIARDPKLWREAWDRNVILVSPSTLLFVLRTVANLWRQEQQTRNVQDIVRRGGELYDKLAAFVKDLGDVGKNLDAARSSYEEAYKKLSTGKGNAIRQAEMLKSLGVKPSKSMPLSLVEQAAESESLELAANEEGEVFKR
ncbi:MAG TPA: DNA recombination protein RmuC [Bryobacteraceae bacterium]|nr:DNA recombination protein RmuC [Bryobacteraceae bacterium]